MRAGASQARTGRGRGDTKNRVLCLPPRHHRCAGTEGEVTMPSEATPPRDSPLGLPLLAGDPLEALLWGPLRVSFGLTPEQWRRLTEVVTLHAGSLAVRARHPGAHRAGRRA